MLRIIFLILSFGALMSLATAQSEIVATWLNENGDGHVSVDQNGDSFTGKLVWTNVEKGKDKIGTVVFRDLKFIDDHWVGEVYSLRKKSSYDAEFFVIEDGQKMKVEVDAGLLTVTQTWTKVQ